MNDGDRFQLSGREIALIFLFWTSLASLSALNRLLEFRDAAGFGRAIFPAGPIALGFAEAWIWAALTPLIFWLSNQSSITQSRWVRIPLLLVAGICIAVVVFLLLDFVRDALFTMPVRRRRAGGMMPLRQLGRFQFANQLVVYFAVLAAGYAREYFLRDKRRGEDAAKLQAQLAEARLDALRMQINPHFLFNTLNAVAALVERDPAGVRRMIARLSDLMRHTIDSRATDEITLDEELTFVRRYVEIMEVRFEGRLVVTFEIDPRAQNALVPNLILQPVVENAFEHGVGRSTDVGRITIAASVRGDDLEVTIRDNGPGVGAAERSGIGLSNTRARLEQMYGSEASLTLRGAIEGGTVARMLVPFHTKGDLRVGERS